MKKMRNKNTGEISYFDVAELENDAPLAKKYKVSTETEIKAELDEVDD